MTFTKDKLWLIVGLIVIAGGALFLYRSSVPAADQPAAEASQSQDSPDLAIAREVNTVATFETPGGTDKVRFTLTLNGEGAVTGARTTDALKGDETNEHLDEFSQNLLVMIRGRKLSELTSVDKVGKSSLTTAAFNAALPELQRQL